MSNKGNDDSGMFFAGNPEDMPESLRRLLGIQSESPALKAQRELVKNTSEKCCSNSSSDTSEDFHRIIGEIMEHDNLQLSAIAGIMDTFNKTINMIDNTVTGVHYPNNIGKDGCFPVNPADVSRKTLAVVDITDTSVASGETAYFDMCLLAVFVAIKVYIFTRMRKVGGAADYAEQALANVGPDALPWAKDMQATVESTANFLNLLHEVGFDLSRNAKSKLRVNENLARLEKMIGIALQAEEEERQKKNKNKGGK